MTRFHAIFDRLDKLSRQRALTENESLLLETAIEAMDNSVAKPRGITSRTNWTEDQTARFGDLIAEGMSPRKAGVAIGKTASAGIGKFDRMRQALGAQSV